MAKNLIQRPLIFQDENLNVYLKKGVITGKSKSGKPEAVIKKGTAGLKSRNALNDITNKSTALPEEAAKKKSSHKEVKVPSELNIAEETFQHDHKKCVEAQRSAMTPKHFLELVLPGCDSASPIDIPKTEMELNDKGIDTPRCYPVPEELPMSEFSWLRSSCKSPPKKMDSPPSSPFEWEFEPVEFTLKEEKIAEMLVSCSIWSMTCK
ncbi:protein PATRONUS 2 isoform X1 [Capsicum chacoense]